MSISTSPVRARATPSTTAEAFEVLAKLVDAQRGGDANYLRNQWPRYRRTVARIQELCPAPARVLDIGSHYLHQSLLLSQLGYEVSGIDIGIFAEAGFLRERASAFGIRNTTVDSLEAGSFLQGQEGRFDLILFTEILEHITFNPIRFWHRVYELMAPTGMIYLSTPNALRPAAWLRAIMGALCFRGVGLDLREIMGNVTYGHHWKEYSAWEIRKYFALLSSDFSVQTACYSSDLHGGTNLKSRLKRMLAIVPAFRSDIEALIRLSGHAGFSARAPQLQMHQPMPESAFDIPPKELAHNA